MQMLVEISIPINTIVFCEGFHRITSNAFLIFSYVMPIKNAYIFVFSKNLFIISKLLILI